MLSFERCIHQKTFERNFLRGTTSEQQLHLGRTGAVETEEDALNQIVSEQQTRWVVRVCPRLDQVGWNGDWPKIDGTSGP